MRDTEAVSDVGSAVGRIPSGVAILTASDGDQSTGMLASWFQQVSMDPLMVGIAVKRGRPIEGLMDASRRFVLNILGENPGDMFKHFGKGFAPDEDAFSGIESCPWGGAVRIGDAIAWIACSVESKTEAGDHVVYVGRVIEESAACGSTRESPKPFVHLRKSGLSY